MPRVLFFTLTSVNGFYERGSWAAESDTGTATLSHVGEWQVILEQGIGFAFMCAGLDLLRVLNASPAFASTAA